MPKCAQDCIVLVSSACGIASQEVYTDNKSAIGLQWKQACETRCQLSE